MRDVPKLTAWVKRQQKHGRTPTVRQAARALGWKQARVVDAAEAFKNGCLNVALRTDRGGIVNFPRGEWGVEVWDDQ